MKALHMLDAVENPTLWVASYSRVINGLHLVAAVTFFAGAIYAYKKVVSEGSIESISWSVADTSRLVALAVVVLGFHFGARLLECPGGQRPSSLTVLLVRMLAGAVLVLGSTAALLLIARGCC